MERTLSNIVEISKDISLEDNRTLTFSEEFAKINKIKYNLSILYFLGVAVLTTTLFL